MIRSAIINHLKADADVKAVLGSRIYPFEIPQNLDDAPFAVIIASIERTHSKDGPTGNARATVQISTWSSRVLEAEAAMNAIRRALDGYRGPMGGLEIGAVRSGTESDLDDAWDRVDLRGIGIQFTIDYVE